MSEEVKQGNVFTVAMVIVVFILVVGNWGVLRLVMD